MPPDIWEPYRLPPGVDTGATPAIVPKVSPILAVIDRMMAAPGGEREPTAEPARNLHAGAASVVGSRESLPKDPLDEAASLFKMVFKGEILP